MLFLEPFKPAIIALCQEVHVQRLDVFGSATSTAFGPDSDVDVLVTFDHSFGDLFNRYFLLKEGLEALLGRPVDVVMAESVQNPYFAEAVERSRVNVYRAEHQEAST